MDTPNLPPRSRFRVRAVLDVVATVALLAAAGVVIWTQLARSSPAAAPTRPPLPVPSEPVSLEGAPILGDPAAKVVMIEFSDFECPFCARFSKEVLPQIKARYVDTGRVRLAFRHLPLERIHSRARPAAEAAECASRQGLFWPYRELLFADPKKVQDSDLLAHAATAGLDRQSFTDCVGGQAADRIQRDVDLARSFSVTSTPAFFFGLTEADGMVRVQEVFSGARELVAFTAILDKLIDSAR